MALKLLHLTPGTGSFYCGSCVRDHALIKALRNLEIDASIVPLYLPMVTDAEEAPHDGQTRVSGITLYLQQKWPWLVRLLPGWCLKKLDSEACLRWASGFMGMTRASDLGEMTVGSLQGKDGPQWPQWQSLVDWIVEDVRPDVISLSNSLLLGLVPELKRRLAVPIVVSLQGEDAFLDALPEPWKAEAWQWMQKHAQEIDAFVAPSHYYAELMQHRLQVVESKMHAVYNGLNFERYVGKRVEPDLPTLGFLARMIPGKGVGVIVDTFIELVKICPEQDLRLRIAGSVMKGDEAYLNALKQRLLQAKLTDRVSFEENLSFEEKVRFLHEITVCCVPSQEGEAFGLYVVEAQACGVPVVQPNHSAFPEILELTQGGVIAASSKSTDLAQSIAKLLLDDVMRQQLSAQARQHTLEEFSSKRMAQRFLQVLQQLTA